MAEHQQRVARRSARSSPAMRCPSVMIGSCTAVKASAARIGLWLSLPAPSRRRLVEKPTSRNTGRSVSRFPIPKPRVSLIVVSVLKTRGDALGDDPGAQSVDLFRAQLVTDGRQRGGIIDGGEAVVQRGEGDSGLGGLALGPLMAVETQLGVVGEIGAELRKNGPNSASTAYTEKWLTTPVVFTIHG